MQEQQIEWTDKVDIFELHYRKKKDLNVIAQQKGIPEEVASQCIKAVWKRLKEEMKK